MEHDGQLQLYTAVASRLKEAHTRVRTLQVPEGVRMALTRKLLVITAAAKHDLAGAARRLERFTEDLDEGRYPDGRR
jgi:cell division protein YceG involved in septum cleavage